MKFGSREGLVLLYIRSDHKSITRKPGGNGNRYQAFDGIFARRPRESGGLKMIEGVLIGDEERTWGFRKAQGDGLLAGKALLSSFLPRWESSDNND